MAKARAKKKVVHSFLDKVKSKAVAAVQDKYASNMEAAFKEDLYSLPKETQDALFTFISSVNAMYAAATKLEGITQRNIPKEAPSNSPERYFYFCKQYSWIHGDFINDLAGAHLCLPRGTCASMKLLYDREYILTGGKQHALLKEEHTAIEEVELNYKRLHNLVVSSKSGNAAVAKLEELGFDCSWIWENNMSAEEEQEEKRKELENKINCINKEALFPCGDNK